MVIVNLISYILVLLGAVNWGLYGIWGFNLVGWIFQDARAVGSVIVYIVIAVAALWLIISPIITGIGFSLRAVAKNTPAADSPVRGRTYRPCAVLSNFFDKTAHYFCALLLNTHTLCGII